MPEESFIKCSVCKKQKPAEGFHTHPKWHHIKVCQECWGKCVRCGKEINSKSNYFCPACWTEAKRDGRAVDIPFVSEAIDHSERAKRAARSPVTGKPYPQHIHRHPYDEESGSWIFPKTHVYCFKEPINGSFLIKEIIINIFFILPFSLPKIEKPCKIIAKAISLC